ncbi:MAG: hypothetical protein GWN07_30380, partial [Actinobacteria bacterium]|nr:hypothetical protein [Actinomycetota bacterium]NIS34949.1 hypothetical protein [Actinomycetota bacterium]NIU69689.1 hypothetical protein [Actinomycetota bacterium]NIW31560.1 hypothetical protein [Actinomycetota bacterium]NIX23893.1 hypothetical protein [Actinomycetota bacterium]
MRAFYEELRGDVAGMPGVTEVGTVTTLFLSALPNMGRITVEARPEAFEETGEFPVVQDAASPGLFEALGMEIVAGRGVDETDGGDASAVAVVNETFARIFLPGLDPVGQRFRWGAPTDEEPTWISIVGVAEDARRSGLDRPVRPSAFLPAAQAPQHRAEVLVRTIGDPLALVPAIRTLIRDIDPELPMTRVRTLEQAMSDSLAQRRFVSWLLAVFAAAAMALAAVGIFGVMAYVVGQRTREIGIRVALGAERTSILTGTLREGLAHAGLGLALGVVASLVLT